MLLALAAAEVLVTQVLLPEVLVAAGNEVEQEAQVLRVKGTPEVQVM